MSFLRDELLDLVDAGAGVARPGPRPCRGPCSARPARCGSSARRPSASSGGSGLPGKRLAPQLPGDDVHLALDAVELGLGVAAAPRRRSGRRPVPAPACWRTSPCRAAIRPSLAAAAPSPGTSGSPSARRRPLARPACSVAGRGVLAGELVDAALVEGDRALVLADGRLDEDLRRVARGSPSRPRRPRGRSSMRAAAFLTFVAFGSVDCVSSR